MTAVPLRSLLFNPNLTPQRANPLQAGNFRHVSSVRRANKRGSYVTIPRIRLRILRRLPAIGLQSNSKSGSILSKPISSEDNPNAFACC